MIFTNLAPNTQKDDAALAWRLLWQPWKWRKGNAAQELEQKIAKKIGIEYAISFESGRTSMHAILTAYGIKAGDEVLLQAYTCVAVPDPVLWTGATPIYVDCDETLTMSVADLEKKITPRAKALIIQHTFGIPAHLNELIAIAKKHNLIIIEDCAHSLGASYNGKQTGSFGDAAFFSFGRDKTISSVFGGMATTNNEQLAHKIRALQTTYPVPGVIWIKQQLFHPALMWFAKKTYRFGGILLIALSKALHLTSRAVYPIERTGGKPSFTGKRLANALALLALHQFEKLDRFNGHRRALATLYEKNLERVKIPTQQAPHGGESIWLRYTIWSDLAPEIKKQTSRQGILLGDWYDTPIAPHGVNYEKIGYKLGSCPTAERIASQTVNLPTDINTSLADAEKIVHIIKDVYASR